MVVAEHHAALRRELSAGDGYVSAEDGRERGVELGGLILEVRREPGLDVLLDLFEGAVPRLRSSHELADAYPRERDDLDGRPADAHGVGRERGADGHVGDGERGEYIEGGCAVGDVRQVVVADGQEGRDAGLAEPGDAAGELPLLRLRGVARLVGVASE